jgi:hypothetical protein
MIIDGNNFISHYIKNGRSFCAGKIGGNELQLLYLYKYGANPWGSRFLFESEHVAGLSPCNEENIKWFSSYIFENISNVDLVAAWNKVIPAFEQEVISNNSYKCQLQDLEPYFHEYPWINKIKDKVVLVVSPFAKSIENNFKNINKIWGNKLAFDFNLKTLTYPTALPLSNNDEFTDCKQIFYKFLEQISQINFDIAIFSTGFTGLMFANEVKKMGKIGIHLGGATQILFGIRGKRWDNMPDFFKFFNENWTYPLSEETPAGIEVVEGGCYWG